MTDTLSDLADRAELATTCEELCDVFDDAVKRWSCGTATRLALVSVIEHARYAAMPALLIGVAAALVPPDLSWSVSEVGGECEATVTTTDGRFLVSEDTEYYGRGKTPGALLAAILRAREAGRG